MTRIQTLEGSDASLTARVIQHQVRRKVGRDVDPIGVYSHAPGLLIGYCLFEQATAKQHAVDERLKMLAALKAAALIRCEFCADIGSAEARGAGITEEQLLALPRYRESDAFDELERLVLDYAVAMTRTPPEVDDELFAALREHFDERQLVELTNMIALENLRSRFNHGFSMSPAGFSEGMVCIVPESPPASLAAA
ncbi:MAG TPA: carboxymuconolactone decarboxylase family protein [Solirubrobacteraceae bacterium]|nr:carboxymuconolactone decarboxylase family protein [Solirubrobacteraceae bacterium]